MFRFTIRDLLWLMVAVGLAIGWWSYRAEHLQYSSLKQENSHLRIILALEEQKGRKLQQLAELASSPIPAAPLDQELLAADAARTAQLVQAIDKRIADLKGKRK